LATLLTAALFASAATSLVGAGARAGMSVAQGASSVAGAAVGGLADLQDERGTLDYYLDMLFRREPGAASAQAPAAPPPPPPAAPDDGAPDNAAATPPQPQAAANDTQGANGQNEATPALAEVSRILARAYREGGLADEDLRYLSQQVASYTGLSAQEAEARVRGAVERLNTELSDLETNVREAADQARMTTAYVSLWCFIALLLGAFVGSLAATCGGKQRDL
ncbi:MAG TPA: hypothetical protein VNR18_02905, partial [Hyphomicrobiales bacterium]|nr:hypothetical protein [Hyphomicrobiales bacterium]